ncbi:CatA-like O-acetyltransferase [Rhodoferax sp.]|jgi:chloramphenicol O-acetyltransferase type A|uniref:CatA-like O-acetyltransferase n=1 Tax=Rhodoferax sp. TaxID=50421 RepID=UPI0037838075
MHILDQNGWHRRATFLHFRAFEQPYFNLCTELDVTALKGFLAPLADKRFFLAYHYLALRALNSVEEFRHRLQGDDVVVHDTVHGSTTVLRSDDSFAFADLVLHDAWEVFALHAAAAIAQAQDTRTGFSPTQAETNVVHFSTLPWVRFTALSHPQRTTAPTAIPKISFGKLSWDGDRWMLPLSVEVHHALVDGVHVGRMLERLEAMLSQPHDLLAAPPAPLGA